MFIVFSTPSYLGMFLEYSRVPEDVVVPTIQADYDPGSMYSGGPIHYQVISGDFPTKLNLNLTTGEFTGIINEMDDYVDRFQRLQQYTPENYATSGSAALFNGPNNVPEVIRFIVRAFDSTNPIVYTDNEYYMILENNWSSDRDEFITLIPDQNFVLDGRRVSNVEYLEGMKAKGYFQD